ncbi:halocyanin domain-containing protein [Halomicrobium salinisoli]|uniref:halocyanin domain-containing protein n=1 Tax=Halomicrobium salinisoli TaxID=2878391 RepID=UPI001CF0C9CB|nr:halocyanin domain-containing protein [Halomicrobium salinisoli]
MMSDTEFDRRKFLYATGMAGAAALAGCSGGGSGGGSEGSDGSDGSGDGSDGSSGGSGGSESTLSEEPDYGGWLDGANNYEATVDMTGQDSVTVTVGYESLGFDPAAVAVSPGTEVTWEWNGEGGSHNVVSQDDGPLDSETSGEEGHTYSHTFEETGTFTYSCEPHETAGMKGAVYVTE